MKQARFGRIVLISSRAVLGLAKRTAYAATKAGMLGLARTWALELAAYGITVNVVAPGRSPTPRCSRKSFLGQRKMAAAAKQVPVGLSARLKTWRAQLPSSPIQGLIRDRADIIRLRRNIVGSIVY